MYVVTNVWNRKKFTGDYMGREEGQVRGRGLKGRNHYKINYQIYKINK